MKQNSSYNIGKILVVDDELPVRTLLDKILSKVGNEVFTTGDPTKACELSDIHEVDVVLLDVKMPHIGGIEVCQKLREIHPNTPIIMLTGSSDPTTCQKTIMSGANDFLTKPIDAGEVLIRVKNAIQMRHLHLDLGVQTRKCDKLEQAFGQLDTEFHNLAECNGLEEQKRIADEILAGFLEDEEVFIDYGD